MFAFRKTKEGINKKRIYGNKKFVLFYFPVMDAAGWILDT